MLVFTAVARIEAETITPWMTYLKRIPKEAQAVFCYNAMKSAAKAPIVALNKSFTEYAIANQWMY